MKSSKPFLSPKPEPLPVGRKVTAIGGAWEGKSGVVMAEDSLTVTMCHADSKGESHYLVCARRDIRENK